MSRVRAKFLLLASRLLRLPSLSGYSVLPRSSRHGGAIFARSPRAPYRRFILLVQIAVALLLCNIILTPIFWPSYTHLPPCYENLKKIISASDNPGRGNPHNEKIFIAAILYDRSGELAGGQWGDALVRLIDMLGQDNVFLSLYENNSGHKGQQALEALSQRIPSNKSIVVDVDVDEHTTFDTFPRVTLPHGEKRIKRIDYLAALRNRALRPLDEQNHIKYHKLLYLNDVYFNPVEVLQLLFCTNAHPQRNTPAYRAACAVDFSNPFKFYDSYATRDLAGYGIGLPFFPWFTTAGHGRSRNDVLAGRDAVRVRSCWGGMVAFDAWYFQKEHPVRFRADDEVFWDASECCLVHADVQDAPRDVDEIEDTGVYMNPYVRVAYTPRTLAWLGTTRRFERLYARAHDLLNRVVGLPWYNPRRAEVPGSKVKREVWVPDETLQKGGSFRMVEVTAGNDGFCGRRGMEVVVEDRRPDQDGFEALPLPSQ
ncbi:alpha-1,3-mannosyltransferase CMT1 [Aspergillus udagawae]|nr:alpha-1,3-mannosyltransferase CMT1 [Aspergillus udagawae]